MTKVPTHQSYTSYLAFFRSSLFALRTCVLVWDHDAGSFALTPFPVSQEERGAERSNSLNQDGGPSMIAFFTSGTGAGMGSGTGGKNFCSSWCGAIGNCGGGQPSFLICQPPPSAL